MPTCILFNLVFEARKKINFDGTTIQEKPSLPEHSFVKNDVLLEIAQKLSLNLLNFDIWTIFLRFCWLLGFLVEWMRIFELRTESVFGSKSVRLLKLRQNQLNWVIKWGTSSDKNEFPNPAFNCEKWKTKID